MIWLSRNTILYSFPPQKLEDYACSTWSGYSVSEFTENQLCWCDKYKWRPHHWRQKNYGSHTMARVHNTARVNCSKCTYFFPKQTENWVPRNYIELFYSRPCLFHEMCYILTLHEKHSTENKWPPIRVSNKKQALKDTSWMKPHYLARFFLR